MTDLLQLRQRIAGYAGAGAASRLHDDIDLVDDTLVALTPAAVLIPVIARPEPTLLLTLRHGGLRRHAGQVAFPGGRVDATDADAVAAALREAQEETALDPRHVELLGAIDGYRTGTGYDVTPVVGIIPPDLPLVPAADEVESLFEIPLATALDPARHLRRSGEWQGRVRTYYVIDAGPHLIWGATAGMIVNLSTIVRGAA